MSIPFGRAPQRTIALDGLHLRVELDHFVDLEVTDVVADVLRHHQVVWVVGGVLRERVIGEGVVVLRHIAETRQKQRIYIIIIIIIMLFSYKVQQRVQYIIMQYCIHYTCTVCACTCAWLCVCWCSCA